MPDYIDIFCNIVETEEYDMSNVDWDDFQRTFAEKIFDEIDSEQNLGVH